MLSSKTVELREAQTPALPKYNHGMSAEELARPGSRLLAMLIQRANELGHRMNDMSFELGVTYGYIAQLRSGRRETRHISDTFAAKCALYLGIPRLTVLMLAGKVRIDDVFDAPKLAMNEVPRALKFISMDHEYGPMVTMQTLEAPLETQFLIVSLYERATGRKLLPGSLNIQTLAHSLRELQEVEEKLRAEAVRPDAATQEA